MGRRALDSRQGEERNGAQRGESAQRMARSSGKPPASGERTWSDGLRPASHGATVSDRHRAGARNPHQQRCAPPISPLRTAHRRSAQNHGDNGAPVSDRHRAGARNPHQQRRPPPISLLRTTHSQPRRITGTWSAGLRPASRGSAKPAPMTVRRTDVSGAPPAQSGLRCSLRFAQRCRPEVGVPVPVRRLCSIRTAPLAPLRGAVPTGGRRSLACASWCPWGYPPRCVARRLASRSEGESGAVAPLSHFPPDHAGGESSNGVRCHWRARQYATRIAER